MRYYPVNLDVQGRDCLVVGGGAVGERKVKTLLECGAKVTVIAPLATDTLHDLAFFQFDADDFRHPVGSAR